MFATRARKTQAKRRRAASDDDGADDAPAVVAVAVDAKKKLNTFSTSGAKKAKAAEIMDARLQASTREAVRQTYAGDATYESQIDTEKDRDARALLEKNIKLNADGNDISGTFYQGKAGYKNYVTKKESQAGMNKYTGTQGPIRAQTWARSICRFDYAPDVCKDYKETGFCGFGDSCKFMHDRGDYKSGWQIDKEWDEKERKKKQALAAGLEYNSDGSDDDKYVIKSDDDEGQFACTICRQPFTKAVETLCGHFFCEACALKRYKKTSLCFNCKKQTNGVFNIAKKLREEEKARLEEEAADHNDSDA
ncbi:hypothetical protein SPRG_14175 [Saprolegnia parasitica CBS 223.65]|uniref:Pre-mRNA-splicing factor CWC24 n=1 Tax=Saprolegnia parasitica (strain CBS 223.65) TaxID=695850 RepID=A0A067BZM1_SAPPC|nr:hypothetical protein SPRG_14175 [Saprolegnia parasitica CBS 223.65]KDO20027.1 hypothetical protein SPRG_14175 [Saprolegnia parasitica CBS 223.65]|eukprot:XP_012209261.1 hypothetical protein SPRG_14175 [Saprolegnia parasitica CBS 223.65]